ncbi:MAG: HpcH/HpaI aldolase/citrate lyase family protein [Xanthobacteraceae bacterium]
MAFRPRRSVLYMPGSNARAMEKARTLAVDTIILDLEDSVSPDAKGAARKQVVDGLTQRSFGRCEVVVRVNGLDTPWHVDDFTAIAQAAPDAILVPKISTPQQLEAIGQRLLDMHANRHTKIWAMIETPLAVFNILALAEEANDSESRLAAFVIGTNDLAKETRARIVPGRAPMVPWLMTCIAAAHAYDVDILDGVYNDLADSEGFARECGEARDMGFDGKTLIHPNQIAACNTAFSPSAAEIMQARRIIGAFDLPENRDKGAIQLEGRMVERLHAAMARRTVAIADAIAARGHEPQPA